MFNKNNISASFFPNTTSSRSFGYGSIDFAGVSVNYSVMPSQYGLGIFVMFPSRPKMKDGVHEKDQNGRPAYTNEVFIKDLHLRTLVDEVVLNAMANKGVYTHATAQQVQQAGGYVAPTNVSSTPSVSFNPPNTSFNTSSTQTNVQSTVEEITQKEEVEIEVKTTPVTNSVKYEDELPF